MMRLLSAVLLSVVAVTPVWAQGGNPGSFNFWHPFKGGTNCIQVADINGQFNCAQGTTIDPTTGNMVISGTLQFNSLLPGTFFNGLILGAVGSNASVLGPGDLVLASSPSTVAAMGPQIQGATIRVRPAGPGRCRLVISGGSGMEEFVIPVYAFPTGFGTQQNGFAASLPTIFQGSFPGGPLGC